MEIGDWYQFHFEKPRTLAAIKVLTRGERFPKKIRFRTQENGYSDWTTEIEQSINLNHNDQNTIFEYRFKKRQKIEGIRFEIIEPTLEPLSTDGRSPAWAIYRIDFKEYRLFGLWEASL